MATNESKKRKLQKKQAALRLVVLAAILVCLNMIAARFHKGLDLTKDERFTLSEPTKRILRDMDDVAVITVYLEGKFPAGFQKLKESTRERLQSFQDVAGSNIKFQFKDPFEGKEDEERAKVYQVLAEKGIFAVNLQVQGEEEGYSEKFVFPWALVQYKGKETPVKLLENKTGMAPLENLNFSESLLEYKFASAIHRVKLPTKPEIAYMMGHDEPLGLNTFDMLNTLTEQYKVDTFDLVENIYIPSYYKAIIINRPQKAFDDKEKFKIDQYVMNGGHVLWVIDQLHTPMDSLHANGQFIALDYGLNLDDQLFKYGVRVNTDLIEEKYCLPMPVIVGQQGDGQPQMQLRPWMYFPVLIPESGHPIVKNLDGIASLYASTIDTIANPEIQKTILLQSTQYSRKSNAPVRISLGMLQYPLDQLFNEPKKQLPVAVLLEGEFNS
ncbi:MAG: gliding motility-associated ABC transporter substrate-binding protein GldG, partial [Chitinophagaceae bacterium]|nr:gliding motility-associated ABC transporter substrate-binding protein GldG [Chitinophagaceae bacterium]